ncbi:MAG: MotA/TolQ/ExbB proton channel family protein [Verrucomicrobiota bacterium]
MDAGAVNDQNLIDLTLDTWVQGGWAMIGLAILGAIMLYTAFNVWLSLRMNGAHKADKKKMLKLIDNPNTRSGKIGEMVDYAMAATDLAQVEYRFQEIKGAEVEPLNRNLRFMRVCVTASPLIGLLGTVTGMLSTFDGLANGGGGDDTMNMVTGGISEALFTTAQGLVIALPGYFLHYHLRRGRDKYAAFIEHLESACMQRLYRKQKSDPIRVGV